jgi:hypothetical protein
MSTVMVLILMVLEIYWHMHFIQVLEKVVMLILIQMKIGFLMNEVKEIHMEQA